MTAQTTLTWIQEEDDASRQEGRRPSPRSDRSVVIPALTGLRLIAALMILLHHAAVRITDVKWILAIGDGLGAPAMPLFFTLSGFVMWLNYADAFRTDRFGYAIRDFAIARFARLYPLYIVVLALGCAIFDRERVRDALPALALWLTFLQAWWPAYGQEILSLVVPPIGHLWSISVEAFLYSLFPAIVLFLARTRSTGTILIFCLVDLLLLAAVLAGARPATDALQPGFFPNLSKQDFLDWVTYSSPITNVFRFFIGCAAAAIFELKGGLRARKRGSGVILALLVAALLASSVGLNYAIRLAPPASAHYVAIALNSIWTAAGIGYLVYAIAVQDNIVVSAIGASIVVAGGEISYSVYMLHPLAIEAFSFETSTDASLRTIAWDAGALSAVAMVTIAASALTYAIIEKPGRRFLRRFLKRQFAASPIWLTSAFAGALFASIVCFAISDSRYPHFASRQRDLRAIVSALEAYKADHGVYPVTRNAGGGSDWVGIGWNGIRRDWLPSDLVPKYLTEAPRDPRASSVQHAQYVLRSDATNYKLIAIGPEDCRQAVLEYPEMNDTARNTSDACVAYGFWSPGARAW
jgi:peptidoglycan/LPS O-acetylase OafA/YrhL